MEISSTILDQALAGLNELALPVVGASCLYLMVRSAAPAVVPAPSEHPQRRTRLVRRGVSALGLLLTVASPASAAARRRPPATAASEVRTEPGRFPPPRLPGSAEPSADEAGRGPVVGLQELVRERTLDPSWREAPEPEPGGHPAVHGGGRSGTRERLFERWGSASREELGPTSPARVRDHGPLAQTAESKPAAAHAQGRAAAPAAGAPRPKWHAVLPGETLWSIAGDRLHTDDMRRIARYWPRIHRANRDEIGPNPNLIRPGQVLELPPEHA